MNMEQVRSEMGFLGRLMNSRELKVLPDLLYDDEAIEACVNGIKDQDELGLLVLTDRRILWLDKVMFTQTVMEIPYTSVVGQGTRQEVGRGELTLRLRGQNDLKVMIRANKLPKVLEVLRERRDRHEV